MKTIVETKRMILRELTLADTNNAMGIFSDPEAMRYYPSTKTKDEVKELIQKHINNYKEFGIGLWAAILRDSGEFAGLIGLIPQEVEGKREIEIGYLFLRKYWGQGLATEAAIACKEYAFRILNIKRVVSLIDPSNMASRRVAEKVGMTVEKQVVKWNKSIMVYSISLDNRVKTQP